jgi:polar amino acid transport system permease protein
MSQATAEMDERQWADRLKPILGIVLVIALAILLYVLASGRKNYGSDVVGQGTWDWNFFFSLVPDMLEALTVTAFATIYGFSLAIVLGLVLALGRRSTRWWISAPFVFFIEFVRSTPLLVQLLLYFNGLPYLGIQLTPLQAVTLGLGIHYATYCSEAYRAGINSVDKGQWEASTALNLSPLTTWTRVVLPQAIPNVLPALGNFLIAGFKDAPLGFVIGVPGLMFFARTVGNRMFRPTEPLLLIGIGFLLVSLPAAWLVRRLEERISYERI